MRKINVGEISRGAKGGFWVCLAAFFCLAAICSKASAWPGKQFIYTTGAKVSLRAGPGGGAKVLARLDQNVTLTRLARAGEWLKVRDISGRTGYVHARLVSALWIKVLKKERRLYLMRGGRAMASYPIGLSSFNPLGDKVRQGDGGTPEGRFFLCEMIAAPRRAKYGSRSMRLSYPNTEDARRGLGKGLIDYPAYLRILRAIKAGRMPPQNTVLGGSIRIHGGGGERDWTLGCIGMNDSDAAALFSRVRRGTRVEVYRSGSQEAEINRPGRMAALILRGARAQLKSPALYTKGAMAIIRLAYPMGDIPAGQAVCTDVVIRALRYAGVDLQALLHEDIIMHPARYRRWVTRPNPHIDHRRSRNLQVWFMHHAKVVNLGRRKPRPGEFVAGDVAIVDTGIPNGTVYDHIGVVGAKRRGFPLLINIWTLGWRVKAMDLLGRAYPKLVGHFRLGHLFDYQ